MSFTTSFQESCMFRRSRCIQAGIIALFLSEDFIFPWILFKPSQKRKSAYISILVSTMDFELHTQSDFIHNSACIKVAIRLFCSRCQKAYLVIVFACGDSKHLFFFGSSIILDSCFVIHCWKSTLQFWHIFTSLNYLLTDPSFLKQVIWLPNVKFAEYRNECWEANRDVQTANLD